MLRWLYNQFVLAPPPRFPVGSTVVGVSLLRPGVVVARRLDQVRNGLAWNEETRGWMYQIDTPDGPWHNEDILEYP